MMAPILTIPTSSAGTVANTILEESTILKSPTRFRMAESGLTTTPVNSPTEEEDKGILESLTDAVGLTGNNKEESEESKESESKDAEESKDSESPGILETLSSAVSDLTSPASNSNSENDDEEGEEETSQTPAFLQTEEAVQTVPILTAAAGTGKKPKKERKKREKRIPIPTNAETFFRAMNKYPAIFKYTPTGDLQVPAIRDKGAFVISLPSYMPIPPDEREAKEQERALEISRVQREYDAKAELLRGAIDTWRLTGQAAVVVSLQRDMKKLDAELTLLRSPSRWTKGKMGIQQKDVFWDRPTITSPLGHRVFMTRIRDIANKDLFVEKRSEGAYTNSNDDLTPPPPFGTPPRKEEEPEVFLLFEAPETEDDEHGFLSPETPVEFIFNETKYTSPLQAFHGERLTQLKRKDLRPLLFRLRGGLAIRKFATRVVGKVENPFELWKQILKTLLQQHPRYATKLRNTGTDTLVYASELDGEFGIGLGQDSEDALDRDKWKGDNLLGNVWMKLREELPSVEEGDEESVQEGGAYVDHGKTNQEAKEQRQRILMGLYHRRKFQR